MIIGERTNANGSKKFREAMLEGDRDTCVQMAKDQVKEGAHVLDVCVDYVGPRRQRRHGRAGQAARHPGERAARARLHRAPGAGGRPAVARRPGHPQLGQPRGRRSRGQPLRQGLDAGPGVRRRGDLPAHRRGGPGPRRRVEAAGRPPHPRHRRRALRPRAGRPASSTPSPSRCRPATTTSARTASTPSRPSAASRPRCPACSPRSASPTSPSASSRRPATSSTPCSCTSAWRPGSTPPSCTRRGSCRSTASPRSSARSRLDLVYDRRRDGYDPLTELLDVFADVHDRRRSSRRTAATGPSSSG